MSKSILIVDDSKFTRNLMRLPLEKMGHTIVTVGDPHDAVSMIATQEPDLIISDLKMPELMDGLGFLRMVAVDNQHIPVIVYTSDPRAKELVGDIGLNRIAFLSKPAAPDKLKETVNHLLV